MKSLLLILSFLIFTISCTRKAPETSKVQIDLSHLGKVSASSLQSKMVVIVNITGPGMSPIYQEINCRDNNCDLVEAEFDVGSRLIQLLVVGVGTDNIPKILYGDDLRDFGGGTFTVPINLGVAAQFNQEVKWMGRYIPQGTHPLANKFLTGKVDMRFYPGDNKPDMKVSEFEIYGGWFQAFLLDGASFKFVFNGWDEGGSFHNQIPLFNDLSGNAGINANTPNLVPAAADMNKIKIIPNKPLYKEDDGSYSTSELAPGMMIGFYGVNPDNMQICSHDVDPISDIFYDGSFDTGISVDREIAEVCSSIAADGTCGTFASYLSDYTTEGSLYHCPSPSSNQWPVDLRAIEDQADFGGFIGAFNRNLANSQFKIFEDDGMGQLDWYIRPESQVSGVEIFARVNQGQFDENLVEIGDGLIDCNLLESNGFVSRGLIPKGVDSYTALATDAMATDLQFAFCPMTIDGQYFHFAFIEDVGGPGPQRALDLTIVLDDSTTLMSGYGFVEHELPPTPESATQVMYVLVTNNNPEQVNLNDFHLNSNFFGSGISLVGADPASGALNGQSICNIGGTENLASGNSCIFQLAFNPGATSIVPRTYYDSISIGGVGANTGEQYNSSVDFIAPVPLVVIDGIFAQDIHFDAPAGEESIYFIRMESSSMDIWYSSLALSTGSQFSIGGNCPSGGAGAQITTGTGCNIKLTYYGDNTGVDHSDVITLGAFGLGASGISQSINLYGSSLFDVVEFSGSEFALGLDPYSGKPYFDFVTNTSQDFRYKNDTGHDTDLDILDVNIGSAPFSLTTMSVEKCWGANDPDNTAPNVFWIDDANNCDFTVYYSSGSNSYGNIFTSYKTYSGGGGNQQGVTYRNQHVELLGD